MTPEKLVRAYALEAAPLERRGNGSPEQLPSAAVETYRALPTPKRNVYGQHIMLGLLARTLLEKKLPLELADLEIMTQSAARASRLGGPCDYDLALLQVLARVVWLSPALKESLEALAERRGEKLAVDRRVGATCRALAK